MEINGQLPLIADILVGVALLLALIIGAKRGLLRSLISVGVIAASLLGAGWSASHLTEPIFRWIAPRMEKRLIGESPLAGLNLKLPDVFSGLVDSIQETGHELIMQRLTEMVKPIIHAAVYLITFLLLLVILRLLGKLLRIVEKLPIIKSCNKLGGALLGLLSGAIVVCVVLWAVNRFGWLPEGALEESFFAKYFSAGIWIHDTI